MLVALIVVSLIALSLLAVTLHLVRFATRRPQGTERERLLERDVQRLQTELKDTHDKLLHVCEKPWNVSPAEVAQLVREHEFRGGEQEPEDEPAFLHHDELNDDLLLVPELPDAYAGAV